MKALIGVAAAVLLLLPTAAQATPGSEAHRMLTYISDALISGKAKKPITRTVIKAYDQAPELTFNKQSDLTNEVIDRYLSRSISHFLPWDKPERSREFLKNTGTKYVHWSHLLWGQSPPDWKKLAAEIDAVHGEGWGDDVVFEAGVMEAIYRNQIDSAPIPDWLYKLMQELGIDKTRMPSPNGTKFFSYENMFDRKAEDWPGMIGRWQRDKDGQDNGSVPDITMVETQLWYAYLITEYIDAGFEGILFGQYGLTGHRDKDCECIHELTEFSKRLAAARGYRRGIFLSTHHYCIAYQGKPVFTHMSWPSRMFYSGKFGHGMECGLYATEDGQHRTAAEFNMLVKKPPFDLPILIEIDNYGPMPPTSSIACNANGDDEITAYMKKAPSARAAFLRHYYYEMLTYTNKLGKAGRVHFAPSGERCGYMPYKELNGEEETIKELFTEAAGGKKPAVTTLIIPPGSKATADVIWKAYSNQSHEFSLMVPEGAVVTDKSAEMKSKEGDPFWLAFAVAKPAYTINVRRVSAADLTDADKYAEANQYLLAWERLSVNGLDGFKTITGSPAAKNVTHRAVLVDNYDIWMLNLADASGGDPAVTRGIFDKVVRSLNTKGLEVVSP